MLLGRDPMAYSYGDGTLLGADEHAPTSLLGFAKDLHYSYDFAGNVTQRSEITDPTGSPSQDDWSFTYDGISQQREVRLNNGTGGRELYFYDNGGQRYMAITFENGTDALPERIRVWMGGAEIWYRQNATASGMEVDTEYAYLSLGAINIGRIKSEGPVVSTEATFANGLSHVMGSVDWDSGIVNAAYIYGPYGEIVDSVGAEQEDHLRRFNGKEADQLSKLSYYGFRYYDEQSLSWTQADPLYLAVPDLAGANPREMSLYTFTMNNPIRYMDPDGRLAGDSQGDSGQGLGSWGNPDGGCRGGVASTDCLHKRLYGDESPYGREFIKGTQAGKDAVESGNLVLHGSRAHQLRLRWMIDDAVNSSNVIRGVVDNITNGNGEKVELYAVATSPFFIDSYVVGTVSLGNLQSLPTLEANLEHPSLRRGEMIAHILLERNLLGGDSFATRYMMVANGSFGKGHGPASKLQNRIRLELGLSQGRQAESTTTRTTRTNTEYPSGLIQRFVGHRGERWLTSDGYGRMKSVWKAD